MNTQSAAIAAAQQLASLMGQFNQLYNNVSAYLNDYNQNTWDTYWQQMPTLAIGASGAPIGYDVSAGSGTVAVTNASPLVTFSTSQTGLAGTYLTVTGDTTGGLYLVQSQSGTAGVLAAAYGGPTNAAASWSSAAPNNAHPIALPTASPLLVTRFQLITAITMLQKFQTFMTQGGGTLAMPNQANLVTSYVVTG